MKKKLIIFLLSLLIPTVSFSQNIYPKILNDSLIVITPIQLKQTNLIFLEHSKYVKEFPILHSKIRLLDNMNKMWQSSDSIKSNTIKECRETIKNNYSQLESLSSQLATSDSDNKKLKKFAIGGFSISAGLLLLLFIK